MMRSCLNELDVGVASLHKQGTELNAVALFDGEHADAAIFDCLNLLWVHGAFCDVVLQCHFDFLVTCDVAVWLV
jgi:hypothetical protein